MSRRSQPEAGRSAGPSTRRKRSDYQQASREYYDVMRKAHTGVYGDHRRIEEERQEKRYHDVTPPEIDEDIRNIGTFIKILQRLCGRGSDVRGIDFGCGSHWFVDFVRQEYGWSAVGYDPDEQAIELARLRFPESAEYYECLDPVYDGLPDELSTAQAFVFCNAVLQHFDDQEVDLALAAMSRVLRPGGTCLLIFKRWMDEPASEESGMDHPPQILDAAEGRVLYFDPTMKRVIDKMDPEERARLDDEARRGWRLFHVFPVNRVTEMAARHGLAVAAEIPLDSGQTTRGVVTYRSGKKMPTACVVLVKSTEQSDAGDLS